MQNYYLFFIPPGFDVHHSGGEPLETLPVKYGHTLLKRLAFPHDFYSFLHVNEALFYSIRNQQGEGLFTEDYQSLLDYFKRYNHLDEEETMSSLAIDFNEEDYFKFKEARHINKDPRENPDLLNFSCLKDCSISHVTQGEDTILIVELHPDCYDVRVNNEEEWRDVLDVFAQCLSPIYDRQTYLNLKIIREGLLPSHAKTLALLHRE